MISTAQQLEARRYHRLRLLGALVTGRPAPMPGWLGAVVAGAILAGALVGGFALWSVLSS